MTGKTPLAKPDESRWHGLSGLRQACLSADRASAGRQGISDRLPTEALCEGGRTERDEPLGSSRVFARGVFLGMLNLWRCIPKIGTVDTMRVAIVHEYLTHFGGAERVLQALMELYPHAPVYTLVHDPEHLGIALDERRLRTSFLQNIPGARKHHRYYPLFMPLAVEQFDLRGYDVVLSASHSFSKGVVTGPNTLHISYCFTPTRYVWDDSHKYVREFSRNPFFQQFAPTALSYVRLWDYFASQRVDVYVTLSHYVQRRIKKYYGRDSHVIVPPVHVKKFSPRASNDGYYLVVSRMMPYKRIDLAIDACENIGRHLKVVGIGPEFEDLQKRARRYTEFLGFVNDEKLSRLYSGSKALLFPQEEDFGITPIEAAASGKPTIAYSAGGARETVIDGKTGLFFKNQTVDSLSEAIKRSERWDWNTRTIRRHAESYTEERFKNQFSDLVEEQWTAFRKKRYIEMLPTYG